MKNRCNVLLFLSCLGFILLFLSGLGFFLGYNFERKSSLPVLVRENKIVNADLLKLLALTGIEHDFTLSDVVKKTQALWLRKPNQERWNMEAYISEHEAEMRTLLANLGMCYSIKPKLNEYDYVVILGALFSTMRLRFQYVLDLWNQGIRYKKIIILAGARPLVESQGENKDRILELLGLDFYNDELKTEADLARVLYQYWNIPYEMKQLPVQIIDAAMIKGSSGVLQRPTTSDTIIEWIKAGPDAGSCLFISNQPYVGYQGAVVKTDMPNGFLVETVGVGATQGFSIAVALDSLARWLYQESKQSE